VTITIDTPCFTDAPAGIIYHDNVVQGSDEWHELRRGVFTATAVKHAITPTLKIADNDKTRGHIYELAAQRITGYVEPSYVSDHMLRGMSDEILARELYSRRYAPVRETGFVTNDKWGFTIGYSPDGVVGERGLIEVKSHLQKIHLETILHHIDTGEIPADYMLQCQTGLLVTERDWLDLVSYCGGMPMYVMRVYPDAKVHAAIIEAARAFHTRLESVLAGYRAALTDRAEFLTPTERVIEQEMHV
jgi:hypothetical protein